MTKEEILHLGNLSRIKLSEKEAEKFVLEIDAILDYVSEVKKIASAADSSPVPGVVRNVFREDVVTNESGRYAKELIEAFPEKDGSYLKVKKILNPDS